MLKKNENFSPEQHANIVAHQLRNIHLRRVGATVLGQQELSELIQVALDDEFARFKQANPSIGELDYEAIWEAFIDWISEDKRTLSDDTLQKVSKLVERFKKPEPVIAIVNEMIVVGGVGPEVIAAEPLQIVWRAK